MKGKKIFRGCIAVLVLVFTLIAIVSCNPEQIQEKAPEMTATQGNVLLRIITNLAIGSDDEASSKISFSTDLAISSGEAGLVLKDRSYSIEGLHGSTSVSMTEVDDEDPAFSLGRTMFSATVKGPSLEDSSVQKATPMRLELADGFDFAGDDDLTLSLFVGNVRYNLADKITNASGEEVALEDLIAVIGIDISPIIEEAGEEEEYGAVLLGALAASARLSATNAKFEFSSTFNGEPAKIEINASGSLSPSTSVDKDAGKRAVSVTGSLDVSFKVEIGTDSIGFMVNLNENKEIADIMQWIDGFENLFDSEDEIEVSSDIETLKSYIGLSLTFKSASVNGKQVDPDSFYEALIDTIQPLL